MDINQFKGLASLIWMLTEADKFHLQVARKLLSPQPLSEKERAELLSQIARREQIHERIEAALEQLRQMLASLDDSA